MISAEERRLGVGASEIGAICGFNPKRAREDVMRAKLLGEETEQSWVMLWGKLAERAVLDVLEQHHRFVIPSPDWTPKTVLGELPTLRHAQHPWAFATIDGILELEDGRRVLLEIKTSPAKKIHGWGEAGSSDVPAHYGAQVLYGTAIALSQGKRIDESWLVALFGTREPQVFPVPFDAGQAEWLLEQGKLFMDELEMRRKEAA